METKRKNHLWKENAIPIKDFPQEVYKVSQCKKCGLLRLHAREGRNYTKKYLFGGQVSLTLPSCNPKTNNMHTVEEFEKALLSMNIEIEGLNLNNGKVVHATGFAKLEDNKRQFLQWSTTGLCYTKNESRVPQYDLNF